MSKNHHLLRGIAPLLGLAALLAGWPGRAAGPPADALQALREALRRAATAAGWGGRRRRPRG